MKFTISKSRIRDALGAIQGLANRKTNLAITETILIRAENGRVRMTATDLNTGFEGDYPAEVAVDGAVAISAKKFYEIIRDYPHDDVMVHEVENRWIEIGGHKIEYHIVGMNPEDFPESPIIEEVDFLRIESGGFKKAIDRVVGLTVPQDEQRAHLLGVYFEIIGSEAGPFLRLSTTDGSRLAIADQPLLQGGDGADGARQGESGQTVDAPADAEPAMEPVIEPVIESVMEPVVEPEDAGWPPPERDIEEEPTEYGAAEVAISGKRLAGKARSGRKGHGEAGYGEEAYETDMPEDEMPEDEMPEYEVVEDGMSGDDMPGDDMPGGGASEAPESANGPLAGFRPRLIPKKGMHDLSRFLGGGGAVGFGFKGNHFVVQKRDETIAILLLEGDFPPYRAITERQGGYRVRMDRQLFLMMLKRMSILSSDNYRGILFNFEDGRLVITTTNPELGESREEMAVDYDEESIEAAFNPRFFIETLNIIDDDTVVLDLVSSEKPCLVRGESEDDYMSVIMPMKI